MSIFESARKLIIAVEFQLVSETESGHQLVSYLQRLVWLPTKFLKIGVAEQLKGASVWSFLAFVSIMLGAWVVQRFGLSGTNVSTYILLFSEVIPLFFVVFAVPSMYGDSGVQTTTVDFVVERLRRLGFKSASQVDLVRSSVARFESRTKARITTLKWLVGLLWTVFVYMVAKVDTPNLVTPSNAMLFTVTIAGFLAAISLAYALVWGYEASVNKLFRAIDFGCDEFHSGISG